MLINTEKKRRQFTLLATPHRRSDTWLQPIEKYNIRFLLFCGSDNEIETMPGGLGRADDRVDICFFRPNLESPGQVASARSSLPGRDSLMRTEQGGY